MAQDDADLIRQTLAGDVESFGRLIGRHQGAVQGLAFHLAGRFEDAEDIAQETFVAAYLKLRQLRQLEHFSAWLRQLTVNCGRMWLRTRREHTPLDTTETMLAASDPSPAEAFERAETRRLIHRALDQLSEDHRLVLTLHYLGGLDYAQIAAFLEVPVSTVEGRMHRARTQLKGRLLSMVEETLREEALSPQFAQKALDEALKRAEEARQRWAREDFVHSCRQAMEAAARLEDAQRQIDILSMLGQADATWLGEEEKAIGHYEAALEIAREHQNRIEEARLLKELVVAHSRHGRFEQMQERARQAQEVFARIADGQGKALMRAALDLAERLPGRWKPGQPGGYAMAAFPVELGSGGPRFLDPTSVRHYSWGCPSRGAALVHLLRPRRFLGPSLKPGATWEDRLTRQPDGLSWRLAQDDDLVARSVVETADDMVVTPAKRFTACLRVKTRIEPVAGERASEYCTRSFCGTRTAWYAPGVGLVKLRHVDQNDTVWSLYLVECQGVGSTEYFPLDPGRMWRYCWKGSLPPAELFEDLCRVVSNDGNTACISSATWGVEQTPAQVREGFAQMMDLDRAAGDLEGELRALNWWAADDRLGEGEKAAVIGLFEGLAERANKANNLEVETQALGRIVDRLGEAEKDRKIAYLERLVETCEILGEQRRLLELHWALREVREGVTPQQRIQMFAEVRALARQQGNRRHLLEATLGMAYQHRDQGRWAEAASLLEEAAAIVSAEGDLGSTTHYLSEAELIREMAAYPAIPSTLYLHGESRLLCREDGRLEDEGSGRSGSQSFSPGLQGTPLHDFFQHAPFAGIGLLAEQPGAASTDGLNTRLMDYCEHLRMNSTLKSRREAVAVPAGAFDNCVLIETQISTSAEDHCRGPEFERIRAYYAGVKKSWYAPGVGLVRLLYQHRNGYQTDIQLIDYELADSSGAYLPLAVGNRWRYQWVDQESGTLFEDSLRVAAHGGWRWHIAFVTRATARHPVG